MNEILLAVSATFFVVTLFFLAFVALAIRNSVDTSFGDYVLASIFGSVPLSICILCFSLIYIT